ncbi:MAG: aldehyde dehydrogenase family protein [Candidatus Methylomirabilales bacterium]
MSDSIERDRENALKVFRRQQENRQRIKVSSAGERLGKLARLERAVERRLDELKRALYDDLRKPEAEVLLTEVYPVVSEIKHVRRHLRKWMRPVRVRAPLAFFGSRSAVHREPKGVVLILSPWNFPFQLTLGPLVSAMAAGNCAVLKPSELSPRTSRFIRELLSDLFHEREIAVLEGDHRLAQFLVEQPFDHIFFTGSTRVGKQVMATAASNLTSVTLELGGKSPVIVDPSADLQEAATKIAWGKSINAGQSCVAPDYVLVPEEREARFVELLRGALASRYGAPARLTENPDYGRIVSSAHFHRIRSLLEAAVEGGARVEAGGSFREDDNFIEPTLLGRVPSESGIMQEEIFGPVLPILAYRTREEAIAFVNARPRPLVLYLFARSRSAITAILKETWAGDTLINDVVVHFGNVRLPFGGSGQSGTGKAHGFSGFMCFTHERSVMRQPRRTLARLLYPPYTRPVRKLIELTVRYL